MSRGAFADARPSKTVRPKFKGWIVFDADRGNRKIGFYDTEIEALHRLEYLELTGLRRCYRRSVTYTYDY